MQEAIIVRDLFDKKDSSITDLNLKLKIGWKVVSMCPMPSSASTGSSSYAFSEHPTCLVIIEK